jgi:hypothetical protein
MHSLSLELLGSDLYNRHTGDGSRLPLLGKRKTGRTDGLMAPDRTVIL